MLVSLLAAFAVVAAACGDDDDDEQGTDGQQSEAVEFEFTPLDVGGPTTKRALEDGDIDIAVLFSSDGAIEANDWVALEDDKNLQPVDNFIPAIRTDATNDQINAVINAVQEKLEREDMQAMVAKVSIDGENPDDVAAKFLDDNNLPGDLKATGSVTVGTADFAESDIGGELYAGALERAGVQVDKKPGIGSRETYWPALKQGDIDLITEFVGTLLTVIYKGTPSNDLDATVQQLRPKTEADGITMLEPSPADSINTFVVTKETADKYSLEKVSDLANVDESLTLGGPPECPKREPCLLGLEDTYGLKFKQ
jgi:osmoprotectant transport system substrate-binding protein